MKNLMRRYISLNRIVTIHLFAIILWGAIYTILPHFNFSFVLFLFLVFNAISLFLALRPAATPFSSKKRATIGKKRILVSLMCVGSIALMIILSAKLISLPAFLVMLTTWTFLMLCLQRFCDEATALVDKMLGHHYNIGIIGNNEKSLQMINHLRHKRKFSSIKYFDDSELAMYNHDMNSTASHYSFADFAKEKGVKELYVSTTSNQAMSVKNFMQEAEKYCIRVKFINLEPIPEIPAGHLKYINGVPVWQRYNEPLRRTINHLSKRAADIVISSLVIFFVLSWLIPLVGLLIKLESRGPVFFRQLRSGRDNNSFMCLKFRSMRVNEESDYKQATFKDSRITKIGAFLRKTSLDEFPQFINVLRGEMSIVGPRPHMLRHTEEYSKQIKHYMDRLYLKPGITGWAQVNGYRGETVNLVLMEKRVEYDIEYMESWSLWFDFKIMVLTFWNILAGEENAY